MKGIALLVAITVACSTRHEPKPAPAAPPAPGPGSGTAGFGPIAGDYKLDIENLCNVLQRSGADQEAPAARNALIAMWLGPNIKTTAGHAFLVQIQPLQGVDKAKALEDEATRVGITSCPLAVEWRQPGAVNPAN
ncbi:hypothetical protein BH11MYX1_BH11MYX1_03410 [soil metagenome]